MGRPPKSWADVLDELASLHEVDPVLGCWLWTGPRFEHGAGRICYEGKAHQAHRLQWYAHTNRWPALVIQTCGNKHCIAPKHLRSSSGRLPATHLPSVRTSRSGSIKMTVVLVRWIRARHKEGCSAASLYRRIAKHFGIDYISESAVRDVCARRTWSDLD